MGNEFSGGLRNIEEGRKFDDFKIIGLVSVFVFELGEEIMGVTLSGAFGKALTVDMFDDSFK